MSDTRPASRLAALAFCAALAAAVVGMAVAEPAAICPGDGTVRFGILPAEDTVTLTAVYKPLTEALSHELGCPVELSISTSYSVGIEAMRAKRLEIASFGPLSYVLAHRIADARAVAVQGDAAGKPLSYAATIVTPRSSGIARLRDVAGHSFAFSDAASTSGHLMPAYALKAAGIDPASGIRPFFAGSHTASFEALRNHKVDAGELNTAIIRIATAAGAYDPAAFRTLWRSKPIPLSPIAVRGDLSSAFRARLTDALLRLNIGAIPDPKHVLSGKRYIRANDADYDGIRAMVTTLHIDLEHINE